MTPTPTIILMGLRGSGKSTLARRLAERLGGVGGARGFVDLDDLTPGVLGEASVAAAWTMHGQAEFRRAEAAVLRELFERESVGGRGPPRVLALGGGTPTTPISRSYLEQLKAAGKIRLIYLRATPATLRERLGPGDNTHRPPLMPGSEDAIREIDEVFNARDPLYRQLADAVIECDGLSEEQVIERLEELST